MFKKILVPVDGSPTSLQAVSRAVALAKAFDGTVTAIYVIDPYPFTGVGADFAYGQSQYLSAATAKAAIRPQMSIGVTVLRRMPPSTLRRPKTEHTATRL